MEGKRPGFPRWFDRLLSVGSGCVAAFLVLMFLPGLLAWAVTGDEALGKSLARLVVGWGFGLVAIVWGLFWFAFPYWGTFTVLTPSWGMRWGAVGMGACFWGVGAGLSLYVLGCSALLAVRAGLCVVSAGFLAGWLVTRWLEGVARAERDQKSCRLPGDS